MKYGKNKPTKDHQKRLDALFVQGYEVAVCHSYEEAKGIISKYLGICNN